MDFESFFLEAFDGDPPRRDVLQLGVLNDESFDLPHFEWCNIITCRYPDTMPFNDFTAVAKQYHRKGILETGAL